MVLVWSSQSQGHLKVKIILESNCQCSEPHKVGGWLLDRMLHFHRSPKLWEQTFPVPIGPLDNCQDHPIYKEQKRLLGEKRETLRNLKLNFDYKYSTFYAIYLFLGQRRRKSHLQLSFLRQQATYVPFLSFPDIYQMLNPGQTAAHPLNVDKPDECCLMFLK